MARVSLVASERRLEAALAQCFRCQWQRDEWSPTGPSPDGPKPPSEQDCSSGAARRQDERASVRQSKRAHLYESAVTRGELADPVAVKAVKRSTSFINPLAFFRKPEAAKDNSSIYYIYSNPLPVGVKDEEEERHNVSRGRPEEQTQLLLSLQEYANDPSSGIVLDPPIFYMQL
ncbi:uncharacterized protein FYW49_011473 isoform 2-T2 [Xenentodon cancila]